MVVGRIGGPLTGWPSAEYSKAEIFGSLAIRTRDLILFRVIGESALMTPARKTTRSNFLSNVTVGRKHRVVVGRIVVAAVAYPGSEFRQIGSDESTHTCQAKLESVQITLILNLLRHILPDGQNK